MNYIKNNELIKNEIYYILTDDYWMIGKVTLPNNGDNNGLNLRGNATYISKKGHFNIDKPWCYKANNRTYRLATAQERHYLETCIKLNKFITFEEAMKTFIPEYVELLDRGCRINNEVIANKIYKCSNDSTKSYHFGFLLDNRFRIGFNKSEFNQYLKISTKEAYDAQFVDKESEFVLPEKWYVKPTNENFNIIKSWSIQKSNIDYTSYINHDYVSFNYLGQYRRKCDCVEITFEQFKKYVLKEEIVEEKVIEPLPQFKIIETIETITKVENNEGNQFFIGDTVKIGPLLVVHNITGFKYNENKSKIMAITNYTSIGIDIDKIEHYIKPKISLDDIKKRYPIGTFVKSVVSSKIIEIKDYNLFHSNTNGDVLSYNQGSIILYQNEIWAKEETLLEKAKRLYPIGTKFKSATSKRIFTIKNHIQEPCQNPNTIVFGTNEINADNKFYACVHSHIREWAEIIE